MLWQTALLLVPASWLQVLGGGRGARGGGDDARDAQRQREQLLAALEAHGRVGLQWALRLTQALVGFAVLVGSATVLYGLVYYLVIPARLHEQEVFFDYGPRHAAAVRDLYQHHQQHEPPTLPTARLDLLDPEHQWTALTANSKPASGVTAAMRTALVPGVKYDVFVELELPDSAANRALGMFMIHTTLESAATPLARSARSAIVRDAHPLVHWARAALWLVPATLRLAEPTQTVRVLAVNGFQEHGAAPLTAVTIALNHPELQVYAARLTIVAQLTGVRYLMYHWSLPTAALLILNIVFVEALALLVVYAVYHLPPPDDASVGGGGGAAAVPKHLAVHGGHDDYDDAADDAVKLEPDEAAALGAFAAHRSGGIPAVHVERRRGAEQEADDGSFVDEAERGAFLHDAQAAEMTLRYRGDMSTEAFGAGDQDGEAVRIKTEPPSTA